MEFRPNVFVVVLLVLTSLSLAQQPAAVEKTNLPAFPYIAGITGDNVNIRSGPGTNYYPCCRLNKDARVKVVGSKFSWSQIVPPKGTFSWISKQYIALDANNPDVGIVTGNSVRVYAGSEGVKPIHSTTLQSKLNRNDKVQLTGQEQGNYYKITPPPAAYLWVMTEYTELIGPADTTPLTVEPRQEEKSVSVVPTTLPAETKTLRQYYALEKKIKAERAKPIPKQNYNEIKKGLLEILSNKEAGKAARYAKFALKNIKRMELALKVDKEVKIQNVQFEKIQKQINQARVNKMAAFRDLGRFTAVGTFRMSSVYGTQEQLGHWRITDSQDKNICYAVPEKSVTVNLDQYKGCRVGIIGTAKPHPQTAGVLVRFTEIVKLD